MSHSCRYRIYGIARTRAFRVLWVAIGLDYEHIPIEIGSAGARTPEFGRSIQADGRRRLTTALSCCGIAMGQTYPTRPVAYDRATCRRDTMTCRLL